MKMISFDLGSSLARYQREEKVNGKNEASSGLSFFLSTLLAA
jgi:hypothetical protein